MHKKGDRSGFGAGNPSNCRFFGKLRKNHDYVPEEVDFQSLTVTARDFVNKSQSKSPKNWIIFLLLKDALSMIPDTKFIQIIDPPNTMLSAVIKTLRAIKILRGIKRAPLVTYRELGICIILVLMASYGSFVFTRLYSLFIYFCISLL